MQTYTQKNIGRGHIMSEPEKLAYIWKDGVMDFFTFQCIKWKKNNKIVTCVIYALERRKVSCYG